MYVFVMKRYSSLLLQTKHLRIRTDCRFCKVQHGVKPCAHNRWGSRQQLFTSVKTDLIATLAPHTLPKGKVSVSLWCLVPDILHVFYDVFWSMEAHPLLQNASSAWVIQASRILLTVHPVQGSISDTSRTEIWELAITVISQEKIHLP